MAVQKDLGGQFFRSKSMSDMFNYCGRMVGKNNFRVFIYSADGSQKLVNSYAEYQRYMDTGEWYATRKDATESVSKKETPVEVEKETKFRKKLLRD